MPLLHFVLSQLLTHIFSFFPLPLSFPFPMPIASTSLYSGTL